MKRRMFALLMAVAMVAVLFTGCGKKDEPNTIKDDKTLADVIVAVNDKFAETYGEGYTAVAMNMDIDGQYLSDFCQIDPANVEEIAGGVSMSMTNSDAFFAVKAKEGKAEEIAQAFQKRLDDLVAQYEFYPVSGSYERAQAGEVYTKGDYVFLIVVGVLENVEDESPDFSGDVQMTKEVIDSMFNA